MEVEADEFFREIYKSQKYFQQRYKKAEQERDIAAVEKTKEDEKQGSPTVAICCRVLEQLKEFKVHQKYLILLCYFKGHAL